MCVLYLNLDQPHNPMLNSGALVLCALQKVLIKELMAE